MPVIDFSGAKELEALPSGDYEVTLVKAEYVAKTATSKGDYIKAEMSVSEEGEYNGRKLFQNWSLLPQSLWSTKQSMIAFGCDPESFDGEIDIEQTLSELVGQTAVASVGQEPDNRDPSGKTMRNTVKKLREAGFI